MLRASQEGINWKAPPSSHLVTPLGGRHPVEGLLPAQGTTATAAASGSDVSAAGDPQQGGPKSGGLWEAGS